MKRKCDSCGLVKDISGGKTCVKGHFICSADGAYRSTCPLCQTALK